MSFAGQMLQRISRFAATAMQRIARHIPDSDVGAAFVDAISQTGFHPFIFVVLAQRGEKESRLLICKTQNEALEFVHQVSHLPRFRESRLIRGIERALQLEIYDAADLLFSWVKGTKNGPEESIYIGNSKNIGVRGFHGYPAFRYGSGAGQKTTAHRLNDLVKTFEAYEQSTGNDALRFSIMEAIALALSRLLGLKKSFVEALNIVDRSLVQSPRSIHLKTAKHALTLKLAQKAVPPRLEKFIGEDNGYLRQFVCPLPFERFDIGPNGDVLVCCGHWLPTSIGNFLQQPVGDVLNSITARRIRQSVTDGSYKYCNHLDCSAMIQGTLPEIDKVSNPRIAKALSTQDFIVNGVSEVMFAFDQTCNLSCPSCRTHMIKEKTSQSMEKARAVEEKFIPLLPELRILHINPAGELFASKPSRKLLELINDDRCPNVRLAIISNGTLFNENEWNKFPGIHNKIQSIRISIDAATKATFEKLRRLGKYETFCENMRFLRHLRSTVVPQLKFSFTYQLDNFREMPAFIDFCDEMLADYAIFERLQNIAFTDEQFRNLAVHMPNHPRYPEFIEMIKQPIFRQKRVWHDFDYDGVEIMTSKEASERLSLATN
jgi:hypothetical protein